MQDLRNANERLEKENRGINVSRRQLECENRVGHVMSCSREFKLIKEVWDSIDIDRVFQSCNVAATADLAVLLITVRHHFSDACVNV